MLKSIQVTAAGAAIALLGGCDLANLAEFRRQLRVAPPTYSHTTSDDSVVVQFSEPILTRESIVEYGVPLAASEDETATARYTLEVSGRPAEDTEVKFYFRDARLKAVAVPALFGEVLGRKNLAALIRLAAGVRLSEDEFEDVDAAGAEALFDRHYGAHVSLGHSLLIQLRSRRKECRDISLRLERRETGGPFRDITLSLQRRGGGNNR